MRNTFGLTGLALAAVVVIAPPGVAAGAPQASQPKQPQPQPPAITEQVEVVATRLAEAPHEVPAAIEVIAGDTLRAMNARTLPQALALASGVDVTGGGDAGPAGAVPEFRGLREFDAFLLVVDGIPWGGAFNPALTTLSLRDIDRVEILRGPAPVTFGATSFVGVIHIVHKPGTESRSYADVSGGSYGTAGGGADFSLPAFGSWNSRLSVDAERRGFADDRTAVRRGHALWRAASNGAQRKSWLMVDVNWLQQDPASPAPREGPALSARVPLDANHNPAGAFLNDTRVSIAYGFDRAIGTTTHWTTAASFSHSGQDLFRGFLVDISDSPGNARGLRETIDVTDIYADSHVARPSRHNVTLVTGGDLLFGGGDATGATFEYTAPLSGASAPHVTEPSSLPLGVDDRRVFSGGYGLVEWRPSPRITVSGGARLNVTFEERGGGEEKAAKAAGEEEAGQTNVRPSGSAGVLLTLWQQGTNHVRAYASYRSTFKPAAFDFGLGEESGGGEEALLEPETANNYETGVKVRALDGRVDFEADVFRLDFTNLVTSTVVNGLPALQNTGKTRFKGLELASDWRLPRHVNGRVTYSFHDSTFVDFVQAFDGVPTQLAGLRLEMSPRHLFGAGLIYAPDRGVFGSVTARYVGSRFLNKRNTALALGYGILDAGAGLRSDRWEVRVDGRNLSNRRDPAAESELGDAQYYRLDARRVEATLGMRF